jgi:diguanylate cyclase (GGDEF)-like protein
MSRPGAKTPRKRGSGDAAALGGIDIFSALDAGELAALAAKIRRRSYEPGEAVFREGEAGDELFVVASGLVSVSVRSGDAEDIELSRMGAGAFFGEMAILERAPRSATCSAVERTECLVLKADDFEALLDEEPVAATGVLERMLEIAAERLLKTGSFLSQLVQWGDDARRRAVTDAATGLFNRRYLEDSFEAILARAKREERGLSFAMFDLDRFGKLNAAYGAEFCDGLIVLVANAFRGAFGEEDILVRYGGDEFCFLVLDAPAEAERKCGAVCSALRDLSFPEHPELRVSCSIGLAHFPDGGGSVEELKDKADKALYMAKEAGRDRCVAWPGASCASSSGAEGGPAPAAPEIKRDMPSVTAKNRVTADIIRALEERDSFMIIGHKDPDEDCVSSMVAFALLANKMNKRARIVVGSSVQDNFDYLVKICRYNFIEILREPPAGDASSALVLVDTPKPEMIDHAELYAGLRADPSVLKIELDHHLEADSAYFGDPGYRLVYEASSTCEIIGRLALKMASDPRLKERHQVDDLLSRNLVLAILSGMIGDSQMGRYLKTQRERWFYARFSALFERLLRRKTRSDSGNYSSKEQVFKALTALSDDEESCFRFMSQRARDEGNISASILDAEASRFLFGTYGVDTAVVVAKALVDTLAERSGRLGLVGFYDDPSSSDFVQFRLRRSQSFTSLDLREALVALGVSNGGGHPGAVGFRIERGEVPDIEETARGFIRILNREVEEALRAKAED